VVRRTPTAGRRTCAAATGPGDRLLEAGGGLEGRRHGGGDLHRLAGLGVAPGAGRALARLEGPEACDGDLVPTGDGGDDAVDERLQRGVGLRRAQVGLARDGLDQVLAVHPVAPCVSVRAGRVDPRGPLCHSWE
jgi:hypothetical protein